MLSNIIPALQYPIIQAPMAGVATPQLAAAICNTGGLGSLGLGASTATTADHAIRELKALTDKPYNLNFFCHQTPKRDPQCEQAWLAHLAPHFAQFGQQPPAALEELYLPLANNPAMLELIATHRPPVVSTHFGLPPSDLIELVHNYGGIVMVSVTSLDEGKHAAQAGIDVLIAQGVEAGGHRGHFDAAHDEEIALHPLLCDLTTNLDLPVIAAGGLMDGRDIAAVINLGAAGAQLGTAFLLCPEAATSAAHRAALNSPAAQHTALTRSISGRAARGIRGTFQQHIDDNTPTIPDYPITYDAAKQLHGIASAHNNHDYSPNWAGQGAARCREMPAGELLITLVNEYKKALNSA
ncbi:nitronate monooxygenase [Cardiobacteriaceae bacterium TAE3-ERU3]|nr:nitronate monooxygenase [Cardiobacteriaceae bacterium TAE3-ERU3]